MTELQPTEIELTGKKRHPVSLSRRRVVAGIVVILLVAFLIALTAVMANRASINPGVMQPATLPPETTEIIGTN